jgi:mono/diheme cytochrome c family protein
MLKRVVLVVLLALSPHSIAETGQPGSSSEITKGKRLYEQYCRACHGFAGVGERPIPKYIRAPGFLTAMPLNEASHAWHHSDEQLMEVVLNGLQRTQRMPAWKGVLSVQDARLIVAYIKSLWSPRIIACQGPKHMSCM